jgi:hypothetical protein
MGDDETGSLKVGEVETMRRLQEEIQNLTVSDHLLYMVQSLSALAIGRLGLTAENVERRDLDQARLAIDAFKALLEVMERVRPAEEITLHRGTLSQLQLTYVAALEVGAAAEAPDDGPDGVVGSP